ncbi:Putative gamma-glutamyltransferase YwrD [Anatilimnocola aggregata]|uniref:Glutathione hydrolase proenzyme n=1 Tax=Anatilimnocola aggregata TaxID=2528021 RepID=A0A517YL18_9BACT|nr:gamma-glutamyltransferase [Anatilimnocola aggregata]QDU30926.1 Putative gamma-glutamyltransferase YwrD [Anatilimnocola aggregata]
MHRFFVLCGVLFMTAAADAQSPQAGYERSGAMRNQSRSVVMARHGMVATSHPLAAQAGLDVLKAGGTAADAAIATNAMLGVVEPMSCGIGGDLFVIYWDNKTQKLYGLNASGRSPYNISRKTFADKGLSEIPSDGVLSWSVPGCVHGWEELRGKFGNQTLAENLQAAIATAEEGFPVSEVIAGGWKSSVPSLRDWPDSTATYLIDGERAPAVGEVFRNPNLAKSYRQIAEQGPAAFYRGPIAKEIVAFSERNGGYFSLKDFADHTSTWVEPVSTNYRGYDVWELPPNGQGIAALQMLNLLEPYDLKKLGHNSAETIHLFLEAKKLAFADRAKFYADPDFEKLPTAELISKEYARERAKLLDRNKASVDVPAGNPRLETCDTVYLTVVDKDRNCCSFIQSIFNGFGSQVVPGNVGFAMQNRGCLFALDDMHLNRLEPHKRPFHTIIPAMVTKDGKPWFCYGVMGGDMQAQGHVQILLNMIDFGLNVQAAGDAARVMHTGSADPTGSPANGSGTVHLEAGVSDEAVAALRAKGHKVFRSRGGYGGYQGILIDGQQGVLQGATEPRKDGAAVGY